MEDKGNSRVNNVEKGRRGEEACAEIYEEKGWVIAARNWRKGRIGEIDLVAEDRERRILCFCEVKTRKDSSFAQAAAAVDHKKRMRYRKLAFIFIREHREYGDHFVRFDLAEVYTGNGREGPQIEITEGAF